MLLLTLVACGEKPKPKSTSTTKARHLADGDIRGWDTYNAIVLVATKNGVGIDTVAQLVKDYDKLIDGGETYDIEAQLPNMTSLAEEDHHPIAVDRAFFVEQGKKYGVTAVTISTVLMDFYTLGGSNRDYPEPQGTN
ncbi:MAG: hypothetical protein EOO61_08915 [Hymenobacter sp.]|nr:MAG: hypothetical protein EOO61_08915 [Hymenobacter sp.]